MTLQHRLFSPFPKTLQLNLGALIICPYWITNHPLCRQNQLEDIGRIYSVLFIKIQLDPSKPFPIINQYSISKETLRSIKPLTEDYKTQNFIIPCTSPWNIPMLPVRTLKGQWWRFVQDLHAINSIVIPQNPVVPQTLQTSITTELKFFTLTDFCSPFFSIPVNEASPYWLAFTLEGNNSLDIMPQGFS